MGDDVTIGADLLGELARREIEAARQDPRAERSSGAPIADFRDALNEIDRARRAALLALYRVARLPAPSEGDANERQALWEQSELAAAEQEGDFRWINSAALWSLHSALDALVEDLTPAVAAQTARMAVRSITQKVIEDHPEFVTSLPDGTLDAVIEAGASVLLDSVRIKRARGDGVARWEPVLAKVGLGASAERPIPASLDHALTEACVLRDVLTHRAGRADAQAVEACPWLDLAVGIQVRISSTQLRRYSAAISAYGAEISHRLLATANVSQEVDLNRWESYGFRI